MKKKPTLRRGIQSHFPREDNQTRRKILRIMIAYCRHQKYFPLPGHEEKKQLKNKLITKRKRREKLGLYRDPVQTTREDTNIPIDSTDLRIMDLSAKKLSKEKLKNLLVSICIKSGENTVSHYFNFLKDNYHQEKYTPFSGWVEEKKDLPF